MPLLTLTRDGTPSELPGLLIVHGLFGSARNWGAIAKRMSDSRSVVSVDMRNHADSFWDDAHDYPAMAADLAAVIEAEGASMDVMGHSMGGKAAMLLALTRPDLVNRLVVADIAPVAYTHTQSHLVEAMQAMDLTGIENRREADARLAQSVDTPAVRAFLLQSLDLKPEPARWKLNLDVLGRSMDQIIGWVDTEGLTPFTGPTLFLSGAESDYVQRDARPGILSLFPEAKFAKIPGAGHWLHAEKPREFEAALRVFLD